MKDGVTLIFPRNPFLINPTVFPPLGILYLSSYLKSWGIDTRCVDMNWLSKVDLPTCIDLFEIEHRVVGISFTTPQRFEAYKVAQYLHNKGHIVIAGGPHPTHMPDECASNGFDFVIQGEGEVPLLSFMASISGDIIPKTTFACPLPKDFKLDLLPPPDRAAVPITSYKYEIDGVEATPIMTSRGCPFNCSFCANINQKFRVQSAERTIAEIMHVHYTWGFEGFMIYDDVFTIKKDRTRRIANYFDGYGFKFRCFSRSNLLDKDTCVLLKKMGVVEVGIGVESGNDSILKRNIKGTTVSTNTKALQNLKDVGIRSKAFIIVGLPGETEHTVDATVSWLRRAQPDDVDFTVFQPLPGSPIFKNPGAFGIEFNYDSNPMWYKGTPGKYESSVSTEGLSAKRIVEIRDNLENEFKNPELLK